MKRRSALWLGLMLPLLAGACLSPRAGEAAGPWRGQVVDAETGRPLEGVIVVAVWDKLSPGAMHPARDFHDAVEVVTDAEGRFAIPARSLTTLNPFVSFEGRDLLIFTPGYGLADVRELPRFSSRDDVWKLMETRGVTFALPALRSREEQLRALDEAPFMVPPSLIPRYLDAVRQERRRLGLRP